MIEKVEINFVCRPSKLNHDEENGTTDTIIRASSQQENI